MLTVVPVAPLIAVPLRDHAMVIGSAVSVDTVYVFVSPPVPVWEPDTVTVGVAGDIATEMLLVDIEFGCAVGYTVAVTA